MYAFAVSFHATVTIEVFSKDCDLFYYYFFKPCENGVVANTEDTLK